MEELSTTISMEAKRSSFAERSPEGGSTSDPPSKIRRTACSGDDSKINVDNKQNISNGSALNGDCMGAFTNIYGFSPSEFLPFRTAEPRRLDVQQLSDDILGRCLFGGYLNSVEAVRLTRLNKRLHRLGSEHVYSLDLSRCPRLTADDMRKIVWQFPGTKRLNLNYNPQFGKEHLETLYPLKLECLALKGSCVTDTDMCNYLRSNGKCLTEIYLGSVNKEGSERIGDVTAKAISHCCPRLLRLRMDWCKTVTDEGLRHLAQANLPLRELHLYLTGLTNLSVPFILNILDRLESLDVSATRIESEFLLQTLSEYPGSLPLKRLHVEFLDRFTLRSLKLFLEKFHGSELFLDHCVPYGKDTTEAALLEVLLERNLQARH